MTISSGLAGDDTLFGGDGDDRFVFLNANTDGEDVIEDFGANGDADVIDLTALFDELGIAPADRADHVVFSDLSGEHENYGDGWVGYRNCRFLHPC